MPRSIPEDGIPRSIGDLPVETAGQLHSFTEVTGTPREEVERAFLEGARDVTVDRRSPPDEPGRRWTGTARRTFALQISIACGWKALLRQFPDAKAAWDAHRSRQRDAYYETSKAIGLTGKRPEFEEFDAEMGEVFLANDEKGEKDVGIAWVANGQIWRTTLSEETRRLSAQYESASKGSGRARQEAGAEHERKLKRLLSSLPFQRVKESLWPLPDDPTVQSTAEWEATNGSLLAALRAYFEQRVCVGDPDGHLLMALWALGASARSDQVDFAPRIMFEAPYGWGKSTSAESLQLVVPRSINGAAVSPAAAHRTMNEWHPVLLVDESAIVDNPELQRVLRAGFKRGARIIRAAQNADRGVVTIDPFGWVILTTQVDTKDDLVNRCYVLFLRPGSPAKRVTHKDPEARKLRTALARLRLDILLGEEYPGIAEESEAAQTAPGLEPRSRDKISALWPFALRYGVQRELASVASRLEEDSTSQLVNSDKGLVATAVGAVVASSGGLSSVKAADLELSRIQERLEELLLQMGEATVVPVGAGETVRRIDLKRWGPRDFTAPTLRQLGLKIKTVEGRARLDLKHFLSVWPSISSRYSGGTSGDEKSTLDAYADPLLSPGGGAVIPPPPPKAVGYPTEIGGVAVGSSGPILDPPVEGADDPSGGTVGSGGGYATPRPASAGRTDEPSDSSGGY